MSPSFIRLLNLSNISLLLICIIKYGRVNSRVFTNFRHKLVKKYNTKKLKFLNSDEKDARHKQSQD